MFEYFVPALICGTGVYMLVICFTKKGRTAEKGQRAVRIILSLLLIAAGVFMGRVTGAY